MAGLRVPPYFLEITVSCNWNLSSTKLITSWLQSIFRFNFTGIGNWAFLSSISLISEYCPVWNLTNNYSCNESNSSNNYEGHYWTTKSMDLTAEKKDKGTRASYRLHNEGFTFSQIQNKLVHNEWVLSNSHKAITTTWHYLRSWGIGAKWFWTIDRSIFYHKLHMRIRLVCLGNNGSEWLYWFCEEWLSSGRPTHIPLAMPTSGQYSCSHTDTVFI